MKKLFLNSMVLVFSFVLWNTSCKKKSDDIHPSNNRDAGLLSSFMKKNEPKFETFIVNADAGGVITSSKGSKYYIPSKAFVNSAGTSVSGDLTVDVKEITEVPGMILGDKPTVTTDGRILQSYGEYFLKASQNGQPLTLRRDSAIKALVAGKPTNSQPIAMWNGDSVIDVRYTGYDYQNNFVTVNRTVNVNKGITWQQIPGQFAVPDGSLTLSFRIDSLNRWRNCDVFVSDPRPKITVFGYFENHFNSATTTNSTGIEPTMLYFKPRNINSIVKFYDVILNPPPGKEGFYSYQNSIPVGLEGTFLAISVIDGVFYADMKNVTIAGAEAGKNYTSFTFSPHEVSQAGLLELINQMNTR